MDYNRGSNLGSIIQGILAPSLGCLVIAGLIFAFAVHYYDHSKGSQSPADQRRARRRYNFYKGLTAFFILLAIVVLPVTSYFFYRFSLDQPAPGAPQVAGLPGAAPSTSQIEATSQVPPEQSNPPQPVTPPVVAPVLPLLGPQFGSDGRPDTRATLLLEPIPPPSQRGQLATVGSNRESNPTTSLPSVPSSDAHSGIDAPILSPRRLAPKEPETKGSDTHTDLAASAVLHFNQEVGKLSDVKQRYGEVHLEVFGIQSLMTGTGVAECSILARVTDLSGQELVVKREFSHPEAETRPISDSALETRACDVTVDGIVRRLR